MSFDKKIPAINGFVNTSTLDWSTKTGVQAIELSCETQDVGHFLGSYRYTKHTQKDGSELPVDFTFHMQANPLQIVEGLEFSKLNSAKIFRQNIRKGEPVLLPMNFDDITGKVLFFFLAHHPQVKVEGWDNPCLVEPLFKLTVRTEKATVQYQKIKNHVNVATSILSMDYTGCKDLIYFLGQIPEVKPQMPMTHVECIIHLLGENLDGLAFKNLSKFEVYWNSSNTEDRAMRVAFKKAERMKLLFKNSGVYQTATNNIIGADEPGVIAYFLNNPEYYEYLLTEIAKIEGRALATGTSLEDKEMIQNKIDAVPPPAPFRNKGGRPPRQPQPQD